MQTNKSEAPVANQVVSQTLDDQDLRHVTEQEEDAMTDTGRTDNDDPVGDAFRQALNMEDDEDREVILWNPRCELTFSFESSAKSDLHP